MLQMSARLLLVFSPYWNHQWHICAHYSCVCWVNIFVTGRDKIL